MASATPVRKKSQAARYLFLFLLGLAVSVAAVVFAGRAIKARQDPFPNSMMQVMEKQFELLDANIEANRCTAADTVPHLQTMRLVGNDLEIAFPGLADDARYRQHASQLRANLDAALASAPANCSAARAARTKAVEACKACHRDFGD